MGWLGNLLLALRGLSSGVWVIASLLIISAVLVLFRPAPDRGDLQFWVFSPEHQAMYIPMIEEYEQANEVKLDVTLMSVAAIQSRRLLLPLPSSSSAACSPVRKEPKPCRRSPSMYVPEQWPI